MTSFSQDLNLSVDPYRMTLRRLRPGVVAAAAISAVISVLMLTGSLYMLQVYDRVLSSGSLPTLIGLFAIVVILYSFLGLYDFLRSRMLSRLALQLDGRIGPQAFRRWIEGAQKGQPLRDLDMVRGFVGGPVLSGLFDLPWVPLYLAVLFMIHPWLGWLTIGGSAVVAALAWIGHRLSKVALQQSQTGENVARDFADPTQRNAEMIVAMGMQDRVGAEWRRLQAGAMVEGQQAANPGEVIGAISRAFRMLMQSGILTLGAYLVIQGQMSGGMIIASSILTGRALGPVDQVISQWRAIGKALESHRRLRVFFAETPQKRPVIALPAPSGQISVKSLVKLLPLRAFESATAIDRPRLLDGVSFDLMRGDAMGVVGASGSGKSTLARLLAGAIAHDGGEIRLDGATRDQWEPAILGRRIGYLPQQVDL
ncbi:MAG: ATP-binding cassette domain-containing protein, partial [Candidatus Saccharibacteria bacterium]|nr:ATP-binding cassette domain-containing protein [Pseudorhodobacter sp.]